MDDLQRIAANLALLEAPGAVAARHCESAQGLAIGVDGVGTCRLPLAEDRVEALVRAAVPSPFGYRDQTRLDPAVRDSWEIEATRLALEPRWSVRLHRGVVAIAHALGFPPDAEVTPTLQKLVIYRRGQFFARHRDSQKAPSTAATLVVVLPGSYRGGEVVVVHGDEQATFATAEEGRANQLSFLGFYADCVHEVRPVTAGARVALTFTLDVASARSRPVPTSERYLALKGSLADYFDDRGGEGWLVHLLDHQYSKQSLDWGHLKNGDRRRTVALRRAADELACDCFLALVDTTETYDFFGDDDDDDDDPFEDDDPREALAADGPLERPGWWSLTWPPPPTADQPWPGDALFVEEPPDADDAIGPVQGREATVIHWVDEGGQPCEGPEESVDDDSLLATGGDHAWASYQAQCEPWTGNEGGIAAKWYHLSAVVLVPRASWDRPEPIARTSPARRALRRVGP